MRTLLATTATALLFATGALADSHVSAESETEEELMENSEVAEASDAATDAAQEEALEGDVVVAEEADGTVMGEDGDMGETEMADADESDIDAPDAENLFANMETGIEELTAEDLIGMPVVGRNNEEIGEIDDLIIGDDGTLAQAVINVGGFLGLGEKPVALPYDELEIAMMDDNWRATIDSTEDQLREMEAYED